MCIRDRVAEPVRQVPEAVTRLAFWTIFGTLFRSHETKGVAVPPDDRTEPIHPCVLPRSRRPSRMSSDATWVPPPGPLVPCKAMGPRARSERGRLAPMLTAGYRAIRSGRRHREEAEHHG